MADNVESFANLQENLIENHLSLVQIPYVLQYNKRDIPNAAPINYLEFTFNNRANRVLAFESVAATGSGVLETLNAAARLLACEVLEDPERQRDRHDPAQPLRRRAASERIRKFLPAEKLQRDIDL